MVSDMERPKEELELCHGAEIGTSMTRLLDSGDEVTEDGEYREEV